MARTTKQLSGGGKDKLLRGLIAAETSITAAAALRLGDAMCAAIADVRVRREAWETSRNQPPSPGAHSMSPASISTEAAATARSDVPPPFDPFVFSALAVLTKQGAAALAARLAAIAELADLRQLAQSQHLAIDLAMTDLGALRAAIVAATEARLAERRAAAS